MGWEEGEGMDRMEQNVDYDDDTMMATNDPP